MTRNRPVLVDTSEISRVIDLANLGKSLLVTGRAGTGKSTLLGRVRTELQAAGKVVSVVAPTGIAALNVGGETIHRHFAFRADLLGSLRNYRPPAHLSDIEVLIFDEISMVRADHFDMVSRSLARAKGNTEPFGGCQVLLFGDLFQLPPVVTDRDRESLTDYQSPFFFSSFVFSPELFEAVELTEIFRQQGDANFIELLNAVRESTDADAALLALNARVGTPEADAAPRITLVPSNRRAHEINRQELLGLDQRIHEWTAMVSGDISLSDYKVDKTLEFAVGAQVMMATNTPDYVNGTMGVITRIDTDESIRVTIDVGEHGEPRLVTVGPHKWEVWRQTREEAVLVGAIEQLPFRLAWAVTIHRSQGQTFDRVVFDRDRGMFEDGQLYVALSRCRTLAGLTLSRPLTERDVRVNPDVLRFYRSVNAPDVNVLKQKSAFVGFLETGSDEYGRLLEIAIRAYDKEHEEFRFCTLINPLRDFDNPQSGLTPESVTLAPTIDDARTAIAHMLSGRVVVTHRSNRLQDLLGLDKVAPEGLWVDVDALTALDGARAPDVSAVSALARVWDAYCQQGLDSRHRVVPVGSVKGELPKGLAFRDRHGFTSEPSKFAQSMSGKMSGPIQAAVLAGSLGSGIENLERQIDEASLPALRTYVAQVVSSLLESALRDGRLSGNERDEIASLARVSGVVMPDIPQGDGGEGKIGLFLGQRICLTGEGMDKGFARSVLKDNGLLEAKNVTRSGCDLLVAQSASSQSRKARAARGFGIPVISLEELLELVEQGVPEHPSSVYVEPPSRPPIAVRSDGTPSPADIRGWAKANGISISDRGRIPSQVRDAYLAAAQQD